MNQPQTQILTQPLASIDIGTNSVLLLIAQGRDGVLEPILQKAAVPRVGRNLAKTGVISEESLSALLDALREFRSIADGVGAKLVGAVATQAFREATNGPDVLLQVNSVLGIEARMIAGPEESRLSYVAVANRHRLPDLAVLDIGGGSTEATRKGNGTSRPMGAVRLLETCGHDVAACRARATETFSDLIEDWKGMHNLVVVGGTASALAMLELKLAAFDAAAIEGLRLSHTHVTLAIERLSVLTPDQRRDEPGMDVQRSDILMPGLCLLEAFLVATQIREFLVSDRGIRYGIIIDWIRQQKSAAK